MSTILTLYTAFYLFLLEPTNEGEGELLHTFQLKTCFSLGVDFHNVIWEFRQEMA